jgi:DNA-binding transcriptional ArsR family regulator
MTQTKIEGKFYPLTTQELVRLCSMLTDSELKCLLYLKTINPFGDKFKEIDTAAIAEHIDLSRRSIQRHLKKLEDLNLIELEFVRVKFKIKTNELSSDSRIAKRQQDRPGDSRIAQATVGSPKRQQDRFLELEPLPDKDYESFQTLKTIQIPQTGGEGEKTFDNSELSEQSENRPGLSELITDIKEKITSIEDSVKEEIPPRVAQNTTKGNPLGNDSPITLELENKLQELNIPLDEAVRKYIKTHHISQVWKAIAHIENTWEDIRNPRSVFLYQVPRQTIEKPLKNPLTPEFLEWYYEGIKSGLVQPRAPENLPINQFREPRVYLVDGQLVNWKDAAAGKTNPLVDRESLTEFFKRVRGLER